MKVSIAVINRTGNYRFYDELENWDTCKNISDVFRVARNEYGKCVSKVYVEEQGKDKAIGWVFTKKVNYQDCREQYLQETWIVPVKAIIPAQIQYAGV